MSLYNTTSVKNLPQIDQVVRGDYLIVENYIGTNKIDFDDFVVGPRNVSFYNDVANTLNSLSSNTIFLSSNITSLSSNIDNINLNLDLTNDNLESTNTLLDSLSSEFKVYESASKYFYGYYKANISLTYSFDGFYQFIPISNYNIINNVYLLLLPKVTKRNISNEMINVVANSNTLLNFNYTVIGGELQPDNTFTLALILTASRPLNNTDTLCLEVRYPAGIAT
jgi:hypothetical protein